VGSISVPPLDDIFAALADPTRRAIVARLREGRATVGELAAPFAISLPAISRHLKVLERARLISRSIEGRHRWCRLDLTALAAAADWLAFHERYWSGSLDRLEAQLRRRNRENSDPRLG
jgi:DNA-binding transcriptional ArsR family regulator